MRVDDKTTTFIISGFVVRWWTKKQQIRPCFNKGTKEDVCSNDTKGKNSFFKHNSSDSHWHQKATGAKEVMIFQINWKTFCPLKIIHLECEIVDNCSCDKSLEQWPVLLKLIQWFERCIWISWHNNYGVPVYAPRLAKTFEKRKNCIIKGSAASDRQAG